MTEDTTKVAKPASPKARTRKAAVPVKAAAPKTVVASAPKPARKRTPAAAKATPATKAKLAPAATTARKAPVQKTGSVTKSAAKSAPQKAKLPKAKKVKLVRDSFTMPEPEYAAIAALKKRCLKLGVAAKKSEILRAAISCLASLSDANVAAAIKALAPVKTGRPAKAGK